MARPISSDILFPFTPDTHRSVHVSAIKDVVIVINKAPKEFVILPDITDPFTVLNSVASNGNWPVIYIFKSYYPTDNNVEHEFGVIGTEFILTQADGLVAVTSVDGHSTLFMDTSNIGFPINFTSHYNYINVVEPGCVRWLNSAVYTVTVVNEQRLSNVTDRVDLQNSIVKVFNDDNKVRINNGYNTELSVIGNDLVINARSNIGLGKSDSNMWEDLDVHKTINGIRSINGQEPKPNGDFLFDSSDSIVVSSAGNTVTITNNSLLGAK